MPSLGISVCARIVASLILLKAWTIRHPPVAIFTQNVGLECGDRFHGCDRLAADPRRRRRSLRLDHGEASTVASHSTSRQTGVDLVPTSTIGRKDGCNHVWEDIDELSYERSDWVAAGL
ncbi:hypothetical protein PR003_g656 [Phytophthora rubi]|uniref:Uncharacterized protein n=1 Tax=Phytophthora rubi TaxID=129364 RepID=A0A6A4FXU8_9STRA|nr:hypothetical protein PR003_g656 [Phytophthora rubi]